MTKIEVEHRGRLNEEQFNKLANFLDKNGKFLGEKDRFSVIYSPRGNETFKFNRNLADLKVRITNKKTELVLKYGKLSGKDARKEFLFSIDSKKFEEMTEFLMILGFYSGVLQATKTYLYLYKGVEFALVKVPNWGYYFEAEITIDNRYIKKANKKIALVCQEFNLNVLNSRNFYKLLEGLNERPGFRFNFKKEKFSDIKKRFINYF